MAEAVHIACPHCGKTNRLPSARLDDRPRCGICKQALFTGQPVTLTDASFARFVEHTDVPVVVDFWAPWCGPCKTMAPAYEQAAAELEPRVRLAKLNTDESPTVAGQFAIRAIPTLIVFRKGQEVARQPGAMPMPQLLQWIQANT